MEARITETGTLVINSNSDAESFALKQWKEKNIKPFENGVNDTQIIFETKREDYAYGILHKSDLSKLSELLYEIKKELKNGRN